MYSLFVEISSEHKKAKGANKNVVATINQGEYKDGLLNMKCSRHSMNRIQSKHHRIGTFAINKILCLTLMTKYISKTMDMMD